MHASRCLSLLALACSLIGFGLPVRAAEPKAQSSACVESEALSRLRVALEDLEGKSSVKRIVAAGTLRAIVSCGGDLAVAALMALEASIVTRPFQQEQAGRKLERQSILRALAIRSVERDYSFDLRRVDLSGVSLPRAMLNSSILYAADLSGSDLYGASFQGSKLHNANFAGANLSGANLSDTRLSGALFCSGSNTAALEFAGVSPILRTAASGSYFYSACGQSVNFKGANLAGAFFDDATMSQVDFRHSILYEARFRNATLLGAAFDGSELKKAAFHPHLGEVVKSSDKAALLSLPAAQSSSAAHLARASFKGADLQQANFSLARIHMASFDGARLKDTLFIRAHLHQVTFRGASLEGADFTDAMVDMSALREGFLCGTVLPDGATEQESERRCDAARRVITSLPDPYIPPQEGQGCEQMPRVISPFRECSLRSLLTFGGTERQVMDHSEQGEVAQ